MATQQESRWYHRLLLLFWNPGEGRVRAVWRILGAVGIVLVMGSLLAVAVRSLDIPRALKQLVGSGIQALVALGIVVGWARYVDRRDLRAYGFGLNSRWWRMLTLGVFVGLLGWGGALATNIALGWASVSALRSPGTGEIPFLLSLCTFTLTWMFVGFWEEVVFRGIVMRNAIEGLNFTSVSYRTALVGGWVVASVLFGLLHANQATSLVALVFWILGGLILGLAYLLTDELAFSIGLHFAVNFGVNNVFGIVNVQERGDIPMIIRPEFTGPDVFVGVSGVVNMAWLVIIGVLTVVGIRWQYGSLQLRIEPYTKN